MMIENKYASIRLKSERELDKYFEDFFDMSIEDRTKNKTFSFNWNKYQTRTKISPEQTIAKKALLKDIYKSFKISFNETKGLVSYRELVVLAMVDKVIEENYIKSNRELINQIKDEIRKVRSASEAAEILNIYNFSDVPNEEILDELIRSEDFSYTYSRPDEYGHTTGTVYKINFERKVVTTQGFSSDD
jgi:hypothetical protein